MVRSRLPPAASLSHRRHSVLEAQLPGFRREYGPGGDQRTGRAGCEPARSVPYASSRPPQGDDRKQSALRRGRRSRVTALDLFGEAEGAKS
jgi:hypothetical protein